MCFPCGKICKSFASLTQHEIHCTGPSLKTCELCQSIFEPKYKKQRFCSSKCAKINPKSQEQKNAISKGMQKAVLEHPESYAGGYNRGRVKSIICSNGFNVLGSWEQTFVEFCLSNHIEIQQPNTGFSYIWKGTRTYFPDFYLPESDQWIEVKGLETDRDGAKWDSLRNTHGKKLKVIDKNLIHNLSVEIIFS